MFASTAPAPVNMLCVRNPRASCDLGSRSEMNARYGSIEVLLPASSSQKQITPSHRAPTNGNRNRMIEQRIAPEVMNGRRRPHRGLQVRSLIAPIIGWMTSPVTGPARLRIGSRPGFAPISRNNGFTADWGKAETELDPEEPEVHQQEGAARHQRLALDLPGTRRDGLNCRGHGDPLGRGDIGQISRSPFACDVKPAGGRQCDLFGVHPAPRRLPLSTMRGCARVAAQARTSVPQRVWDGRGSRSRLPEGHRFEGKIDPSRPRRRVIAFRAGS